MSLSVEAMNRLGVWVEKCERCDCVYRGETGLLLHTVGDYGEHGGLVGGLEANFPLVPRVFVCSLACAVAAADARPDRYRNQVTAAGRWSPRREEWVRIGVRPRFQEAWSWTDTGEALWIEENAARLRAAREIS